MKLNFYHGVIASLLILLLIREGCHCVGNKKLRNDLAACQEKGPVIKRDTTTRIDSIPVVDSIRVPIPVPVAYIPSGYVNEKDIIIPDPEEDMVGEIHDSAYIAYLIRVKDDYFSKVAFKRSIPTEYGSIGLEDTTYQNRLLPGRVTLDLKFPHTTSTITNTVAEKKRNQVYLGFQLQGRRQELLTSFGPSISFKTKGDMIIRGAALYNLNGYKEYQAGAEWKISFR